MADWFGRQVFITAVAGRSRNVPRYPATGTPRSSTTAVPPSSSDELEDAEFATFRRTNIIEHERELSVESDSTLSKSSFSDTPTVFPSQGDAVLISFLGPDQYETAITAGKRPLADQSESEHTNEMEGGSGGTDLDGSNSNDPSKRQSKSRLNEPDIKSESTKMAEADAGQNKPESNTANGVKEQPEPMEIDADGSNGTPKAVGKLDHNGDTSQNQAVDLPLDPELMKQGQLEPVPKEEENEVANKESMELDGSETTGETAVSLMTLAGGETTAGLVALAGGAINQYLSAQQSQSGVNGVNWGHGVPSSPESPNKPFSGLSPPLPSMMGQNSSPTNRDGKHTTLPPLNSIDVLAELATKQESPQQMQGGWPGARRTPDSRAAFPQIQAGLAPPTRSSTTQGTTQSPPGLPPPTPNSVSSAEGTPRPSLQHLSVQQRQHFMSLNEPNFYPHHQPHYPPITDAASSPQPAYPAQPATPDSANLFARSGFAPAPLPPNLEGRSASTSSEFQYNSDQTTPRGPSTGETLPSSGPEEVTPSPPAPPPPPRNQRAQTGPLATGGFKCEFPDCKAPPFQTQYLLK